MTTHDYDWVSGSMKHELPEQAKHNFEGGTEAYRDGVNVRWKGTLGPDITVLYYPEQGVTRFSGSPHKLDRVESVGDYGVVEIKGFAEMMADLLHAPLDVVMQTPLSRFDLGYNLDVEADPSEYLKVMSPPRRMVESGSGPGSRIFKNGMAELISYDKVKKIKDLKRDRALPESWQGRRKLRVEVRFKRPRKEFGFVVRIADLCDPLFYERAVRRWSRRVEQIVLCGETLPVPLAAKPSEMVEGLARIGMHATGGPKAMAERIERGLRLKAILPHNAKRELEWVRACGADDLPGNLSGEFQRKVREAVAASLS